MESGLTEKVVQEKVKLLLLLFFNYFTIFIFN
jgi:hypothetical protein